MPFKKYHTDLENIYAVEKLKSRITNDEISSENPGSIYTTPIEALAVNILKKTNILPENTVFSEVDPCLLCGEGLYLPQEFLLFKEFTLASCGHIYYQKYLEKHLVSREPICSNKKCNKIIETFLSPEHFKGSQDKPTTSIAEDTATKQLDSENPTPIGEDANTNYMNELRLLGEEDLEQGLNDAQKKRSREDSEGIKSGESTEKLSSKKAKKTSEKKISSMLKNFIKELISDVEPIPSGSLEETNDMALNTRGIFLQLSDKIDSAESKNKEASRALISSYFDFGEALFNRYKELKPTYGKEGARALVKSKVRKEISKTKLSEDALRKRMERAQKMHRIFNTIDKEKIVHIVFTPSGLILNLTGDDTDYVIAEVLKHNTAP
ncbi:hypothetical protein F8M41_015593 [Gigaspora margarita]|uniref:RING-type domain-containing protein n=1 Tax=Gigaspora margarita TaxID=4874 RepID=A0A8H4AQM0_GIGMA|nr:hypothetical protein F8M41_015593 [Gigaspora margarita]